VFSGLVFAAPILATIRAFFILLADLEAQATFSTDRCHAHAALALIVRQFYR
jgi:hypothetical protein